MRPNDNRDRTYRIVLMMLVATDIVLMIGYWHYMWTR